MTVSDLERAFRSPQKSERWVMYRLVLPIVDRACKASGLATVFELPKNSGSVNSSWKVDIALVRGDSHIWYIETKGY